MAGICAVSRRPNGAAVCSAVAGPGELFMDGPARLNHFDAKGVGCNHGVASAAAGVPGIIALRVGCILCWMVVLARCVHAVGEGYGCVLPAALAL